MKYKGITLDDENYYKGIEGITCTPMTTFKVIT
jgi:hypothetical protein